MQATGPARVTWPLVFGPLHDALLEDSLARATGEDPPQWSWWVRFLRASAGRQRGAGRRQISHSPPVAESR
jgi:hypothetical protein